MLQNAHMDARSNDVATLTDSALAEAAFMERRKAAQGNFYALERAQELESELRRRAGIVSTLGAPLAFARPRRAPWWRFW